MGGSHLSQVRPPLTGPTIGAFKKLAPLRNWQNQPMAGTHLGVVKTLASPAWVDHTSDHLIKGSGRSCLPQMNGTRCHPLFVFSWSWLVAGSPDTDQVSLSFHRHLLQDQRRPPSAVLGPFQVQFWGGHAPKPKPKDHAQRTHHLRQEESTRVWPGGRRCGWECSPTTLVA